MRWQKLLKRPHECGGYENGTQTRPDRRERHEGCNGSTKEDDEDSEHGGLEELEQRSGDETHQLCAVMVIPSTGRYSATRLET